MQDTQLAADIAARQTALTALDRTLLVEAGAGSGKTSVLAGRVAALLAAGTPARAIAAITFTELAAGELRARVAEFVAELAEGMVRPDLLAGFGPAGPTVVQRRHLVTARDKLDELTCTTIHGFCQRLQRPYPAEAGMDPGAVVMDREDADALRDEVLDEWLRERLSGPARPDDLLAALFLHDAAAAGKLVREALRWMAHHRGAPVPELKQGDPIGPLRHAAAKLRTFLNGAVCREEETVAIADELDALMATVTVGGTAEVEALLHAFTLRAPNSCAKPDGGWKAYQKKGKWQKALKASGSKIKADMLFDEAHGCYTACKNAHEAAQSYAAGRILHLLAGELRTVLTRFGERKRSAALIDFDDLLTGARDLLATRPQVRDALAARYVAVLVDEFQDTDPLQCEILWRLCAAGPDGTMPWQDWTPRPGALFLVGDPKQAIYRFRGANVSSYIAARERLMRADPASCIAIGQNFRSVAPILDWVNARFEVTLSAEGQPGFSHLFTTVAVTTAHAAISVLPIQVSPDGKSGELRDAEAEAVAAFCARVIGVLPVRGKEGTRPCRPDDIALLAPSGTELWRYERALEEAGIAVSTQAGKGFFRRQEIQDLLALTRTLADSSDTLALGALLRGPLVGLTEEALLDATGALPPRESGNPSFLKLWTPPLTVDDPLLRETLAILQVLARAARGTTPFVLLSQAVEELQVRPLLRRRHDRTAERALANLDQFLDAARAYDTRGLLAFARAMTAQWKEAQRTMEGRPDTEQQSVSLVTMHASKGLEWPVVVPVNMGGRPGGSVDAALDGDGRLHLRVFGFEGPGCAEAMQAERLEVERERHRLWYVAATRARDLLLLPCFSTGVPKSSWQECVGLDHADLDHFNADALGEGVPHRTEDTPNEQDRARFKAEAAVITAQTRQIRRVTPHLAEAGAVPAAEPAPLSLTSEDSTDVTPRPHGSLARGLVLHKLIEEVLTGETAEDEAVLRTRAAELAGTLDAPGAAKLDALEAAATILRALSLPEVRAVRARLLPECAVAASMEADGTEEVTLGIADAVAFGADGAPELVVDWKSDVDPAPAIVSHYRAQVRTYLRALGAAKGLIVFLTSGRVERVTINDW